MEHLEGSGTPVLYIGRKVLKGYSYTCTLEDKVLSGIFGPKRDEVTEEWRKLHNEELNDLYCSPNIVWVIK